MKTKHTLSGKNNGASRAQKSPSADSPERKASVSGPDKRGTEAPPKSAGYDHSFIEKKWQKRWSKDKLYEAQEGSRKPKYYALVEFPYPSGAGLHVGHPRPYIGLDIIARKRRMEGFNVLYPMGWDAFGLPTENYAIKTGMDPAVITKQNSDTFRRQIQSLGISFDWSREINTTDPKYYKWTQWIFLQFFKAGLAYKAKMTINWCPKDKIGLANEEVVNGACERCGTLVEKREKEQWMLAITKYADRLDRDLDMVDYREDIKIQQRNWIGRSEGAVVRFSLVDSDTKAAGELGQGKFVDVFTTRIDTIFSGTFVILAPEHPLINELGERVKNRKDVEKYIAKAKLIPEADRTAEGNKSGVELKGVMVKNPATGEKMPVWVADFVLGQYGTGAVFADAHDTRDFAMAKKYGIPLKVSVRPQKKEGENHAESDARWERIKSLEECFADDGVLDNSKEFSGMTSAEARPKITAWLSSFGFAQATVKYKLRDWVFSRQRYWGEPIPMIHCHECGWVPVPSKDLPVKLPQVKNYQPTDSGESPLSTMQHWVHTKCPKCKGPAERETDTMPNWAGSSWYFLRYTDPKNGKAFADRKRLKHWMPVDWYNGGMEHTTLHLLYARFWHKFLFDQGFVLEPEPFKKRTSHGIILAEDGEKMSKSRGNVVNPDEIVGSIGADALRTYEMFMGPFDQAIKWSTDNMVGCRRFLEKVWRLRERVSADKKFDAAQSSRKDGGAAPQAQSGRDAESAVHKAIKKVGEDIEAMSFNTAVSAMMILANDFEKREKIPQRHYEILLRLLAPFAPHITEELWASLGHSKSVHLERWPHFEHALLASDEDTFVLQVNGKVRGTFKAVHDADENEVKSVAFGTEEGKKWLSEATIRRIVFIPNRLINFILDDGKT